MDAVYNFICLLKKSTFCFCLFLHFILLFPGSSQSAGFIRDSKAGLPENETAKIDSFAPSKPPVVPSSGGHDIYQGPVSHRSGISFDHESPSSLDTRSTNSQSNQNQKDNKKVSSKRKRAETSQGVEPHSENSQQADARNAVVNPRKGKLMNKVEHSSSFSVKGTCTRLLY